MKEIKTRRLVLRKPEHKNKAELVSRIGDWEVAKWLSRVPYPYTADDAEDWFEILKQQELNFNIFVDDALIGGIGLTEDDDEFYELGYWIARDFWGQGIATEAGEHLLHYARYKLQLTRIKSSYMQGNSASANVLRKLGFEETGEDEIYCLSRDETMPCVKLLLA